ncbi:MAG: DinB family protein [Chloroflexi bacterium]|nr:DinB family protein [Chloroflexota bacterium]
MISPQELAGAFERNLKIVQAQTKGLRHADSLLQPPFRGNCLNWVLGHLVTNRDRVLTLLGEVPAGNESVQARYGYGSEPVRGEGEGVLRLETLLDMLARSQERINIALARITPEELAKETQDHRGKTTVAERLFFLYFHETYHVGQTELLRQLAGTDDKVI